MATDTSDGLSKSLLDVVLERVEGQQGKTQILSRTLWVGKLRDGVALATGQKLTRDVLNDVRKVQERAIFLSPEELEGSVTGIQLGLSTFLATFVEASPTVLEHMYETLIEHEQFVSVFEDIRVIAYADDIPKRTYSSFVTKDVAPATSEAQIDEENVNQALSDFFTNLIQLGETMAGKRDAQLASFLETMKSTCVHLLPTGELLRQIFITDTIVDIEEFVDAFVRPIDVTLDSELVWPAPEPPAV
jgi:hypothetical protein